MSLPDPSASPPATAGTQLAALRGLAERAAELAEREAVIARNRQAAERDEAESFKAASRRLEPGAGSSISEAQAKYVALRQTLEATIQSETQTINDRCDRCIRLAAEIAQRRGDVEKHHYQETAWMAKNEISATTAKERQQLKDRQAALAELEARRAAVADLEEKWLKRYRDILPTTTDADHAAKFADETDLDSMQQKLESDMEAAEAALATVRGSEVIGYFRWIGPIGYLILTTLLLGGAAYGLHRIDLLSQKIGIGLGAFGAVVAIVIWILNVFAKRRVRAIASAVETCLSEGTWLTAHLKVLAQEQMDERMRNQKASLDAKINEAHAKADDVESRSEARREQREHRIEAIRTRMLAECAVAHENDLPELLAQEERELDAIRNASSNSLTKLSEAHRQKLAAINESFDEQLGELRNQWRKFADSAIAEANALQRELDGQRPDWSSAAVPVRVAERPPLISLGALQAETAAIFGRTPIDEEMQLPLAERLPLAANLSFPDRCHLLIEGRDELRAPAIGALQAVVSQLLAKFPAGNVRFTMLDPVGLGQSFAGFMHLADYDDDLIGGRIWTDERQIEQALADLNDHMETVIQKYLRNEYATIADYNRAAGQIAEPYRFVVVADFPTAFSDNAVRRLASIIESGARCGVYALIHWDRRAKAPTGFSPADLRRSGVHLEMRSGRLVLREEGLDDCELTLYPPPPQADLMRLLEQVGEGCSSRARVEVPFSFVAPEPAARWSRSSAEGLEIPIGQTGTRDQRLRLGHGTAQHVLIAGNTGSGKSTLLHVLITNAALWYAPDELQLFLVDFKKGVEFKAYAVRRLPHAQAIAIESDRGFGLSVLQRIDEILQSRGAEMRLRGVQNVAAYRKLQDTAPMPRILLIIDEFQEFFTEDDAIAQEAGLLLDRIVRQGRAFGVHVLLGSQTLGGAYSLARATMGQMSVRIALQCSDQDAQLILGDDNAAARLLSRPGEAIYNDAAGAVEANSPFQVVWLPEAERDAELDRVRQLQDEQNRPDGGSVFVFEGNAPADVGRNQELAALLATTPDACNPAPKIWLGAPNAIKGATHTVFRRQGGNNLLIVGRNADSALALAMIAVAALAKQRRPDQTQFYLFDGSAPDDPLHGRLATEINQLHAQAEDVPYKAAEAVVAKLHAELLRRQQTETPDPTSVYLILYGLQRYRSLRADDDYSYADTATPDKQFADLLRDGPDQGIHAIVWCDTLNNLNRTLTRKTQREFDHRVLYQMSPADSMALMDTPAASRLGEHRAIFFNEQDGVQETFNPYALPAKSWLADPPGAETQ